MSEDVTPARELTTLLKRFLDEQEAEWQKRLERAQEYNELAGHSDTSSYINRMNPAEVDRSLAAFSRWLDKELTDAE